ncbi:MAG: PaaI family thioesterase [Rhodospirillaceae bacterium]|nr:PaaI family thioesterase [Rhodospirillaceae bacterium]
MKISRDTSITPEIMNARLPGSLPGLMGIEITEIRDGELDARMPVQPDKLAPNGFLHAASVIALADTACGVATWVHMPDGAESFTTIELKSNFLGTARDGEITCTAKAQHMGRTTQVWDAEVKHTETGRTIALFRCSQMILWPR